MFSSSTTYSTCKSKSSLPEMTFLQKCFGGSKKQPSATIEDLCHLFSLSQLRKSTNNFDKSRIIGEGGFSVVHRACISINGQRKYIALKRLRDREASSPEELSLYKNNIILRCLVQHPNLVFVVVFCDDGNELIVAYDYAPNGSLYHQLYTLESESPIQKWKKRLEISIGVACGLRYLHSGTKRTIIHHDIRPRTILLCENWVPKLAYFGLSLKEPKFSAKNAKPLKLESLGGPCECIAPECFSVIDNVTYKCDVYVFGVVLLELIFGKTCPKLVSMRGVQLMRTHVFSFTISVAQKLRNSARTGNGEGIIDERLVGEIAPQCLKLYMEITESCLSEDPNERPDMGDVEGQLERLLQLPEEADAKHASHSCFI